MEWRYKTVHYAVKKDGLLGGSFLDEEEMESSLNECGEQGWELVSLLEVRDGVVAVFKQEKGFFKGGPVAEIIPDKDRASCPQDTSCCDQQEVGREQNQGAKAPTVSPDPVNKMGKESAEGGFAEIKIE